MDVSASPPIDATVPAYGLADALVDLAEAGRLFERAHTVLDPAADFLILAAQTDKQGRLTGQKNPYSLNDLVQRCVERAEAIIYLAEPALRKHRRNDISRGGWA